MGLLISLGFAALLSMVVIAGRTLLAAVSDGLVAQWRRMTPFGRVAASLAVGACVLYGGGKTRSAKGTPGRDVVRAANWNIRGAWEDSFDFDFAAGWVFPSGTNRLAGIEVFSQGYIRPPRDQQPTTGNQPLLADLGARVSIIPGVSSFSYEFTLSNSYRFTWNDVPIGRQEANNQQPTTNNIFSIDLFRSGDTLVVSNGVAAYRERVLPFDWDRDGILNEKDARPYIHDGDHFGNDNSLPEGANSNNYCWVEVVVADAAARVTFAGDGPSDYPDPDFVAMPGVAYRVALLIGKTYVVSCDESVSVVERSSDEITVTSGSDGLTIVWPVTYEIESFARSFSRNIRMLPPGLSGTFSWSTNTCCAWVSDGSSSVPGCNDGCTCGGCTLGSFTFHYEGYSLTFGGIACGCEPKPDEDEEEDVASVSVTFSEDALFYEEAYTNAPGDVVGRRHSTNVTVKCVAKGGPNGGVLNLTRTGFEKLSFVGGDTLPETTVTLAPSEMRTWEALYAPLTHSAGKDDVVISARFDEYVSGEILLDEDQLTVVRVWFCPKVDAPNNNSPYRHTYGVREIIDCYQFPEAPVVEWITRSDGRMISRTEFLCPLFSVENPLMAKIKNSEYTPLISVLSPSGVIVRDAGYEVLNVSSNSAGGLVLKTETYLLPLDVSFGGIAVEEVPSAVGAHSGYFSHSEFSPIWTHSRDNGAGTWVNVGSDNYVGIDKAGITNELLRITSDGILVEDDNYGWAYGTLVWNVPFGWNERNTSNNDPAFDTFADETRQEMVIFPDGMFGVRKHQNVVIRYVDGRVYLNGVQKE